MNTNLKSQNKTFIPLLLILLLATILRLLYLDVIPNGFFVDEASNGYDAYSLMHTLKDRYGTFLPVFLRAFDDYREALFIYLMIPSIKLFGLNEFATRLPAAIIGILTVLVIYFLAKELFNKQTGLIAALVLAVSPWHLQYSRIAFRAIMLPFLFSIALLFFLRSFRKDGEKNIIISCIFFALSLYTYSSARVFISLFLLGLVLLFWQHLWQHKKQTLIGTLLILLIFIPLSTFWISPEGLSRLGQVGLEKDPIKLLGNYFSYFNPVFLFWSGDNNLRLSPPNLGQLYYFEIITVALGIFALFRGNARSRNILLLWLFLYPFPGALTEPQHSIRSIVGSVLFPLLSAYGIEQLIRFFKLDQRKYGLGLVIAVFLAITLPIFIKLYFIDYPRYVTKEWQYGVREAIVYAQNSPYDPIIMKRKKDWIFEDRSYSILVAFYTQIDPKQYLANTTHPWNRSETDPVYTLGKFSLMTMTSDTKLPDKFLLIVYPDEKPVVEVPGYNWTEVHAVKDPLGNEHFKLDEITKSST